MRIKWREKTKQFLLAPPSSLSALQECRPLYLDRTVCSTVQWVGRGHGGQEEGCMWPVASCVTLGETLETVMSKLITIINARDTTQILTDLRLTGWSNAPDFVKTILSLRFKLSCILFISNSFQIINLVWSHSDVYIRQGKGKVGLYVWLQFRVIGF